MSKDNETREAILEIIMKTGILFPDAIQLISKYSVQISARMRKDESSETIAKYLIEEAAFQNKSIRK